MASLICRDLESVIVDGAAHPCLSSSFFLLLLLPFFSFLSIVRVADFINLTDHLFQLLLQLRNLLLLVFEKFEGATARLITTISAAHFYLLLMVLI